MTDYLEEHLDEAGALLEQVRQMERSMSGLPRESGLEEESVDSSSSYEQKKEPSKAEADIVSEDLDGVDNLKKEVNKVEKEVYDIASEVEIREKEAENAVNRQLSAVDEKKTAVRDNSASEEEGGEDTGEEAARTNAEKAKKNSAPLAVQLEELDRAVSALTAASPEREEASRSRFPVSLSASHRRGAYPDLTSASGGDWSGGGGTDGFALPPGGTLSWAEQADRVFRRDSRRYDGGFSLY